MPSTPLVDPQVDEQDSTSPPSQPQEQEQEWSFVKPKKGRKGRSKHPPSLPASVLRQQRSNPPRSAASIEAEYHTIRSDWVLTQCCAAIRSLIRAHGNLLSPVRTAVCLGIGTFDPVDGAWEAKRRTYIQLIAFLVMVEELQKFTNSNIQCMFQEPIFTPADKTFLSAFGTVLDSPGACEAVTRDSLLYGIHLYRPIYADALHTELPAIYVGTGWDIWDGLMLPDMDDIRGIKTMEETYRKFAFPQDSGTAFSSTCLYWRKSRANANSDPYAKGAGDIDSEDVETHLMDKMGRVNMS